MLGARARIVVAATSLVAGAAIGCGGAMSQREYEQLSKQVGARNEQRYADGVAALGSQGYTIVHDAVMRYASLDEAARAACARPGAEDPGEPVRITVTGGSGPDAPAPPPVEVTATRADACAFFASVNAPSLSVTMADGAPGRLDRAVAPRLVARGPGDELVVVVARPRVIASRKVRVDRSCDRAPDVPLEPIYDPHPVAVLWAGAPAPREIEMPFDREDLETECTAYTE